MQRDEFRNKSCANSAPVQIGGPDRRSQSDHGRNVAGHGSAASAGLEATSRVDVLWQDSSSSQNLLTVIAAEGGGQPGRRVFELQRFSLLVEVLSAKAPQSV